MHELIRFPRTAALAAIRAYQKTLSPDHGLFAARYPYGFCRFSPTCSEYAYSAIERHGLFRGTVLGIWRIIRCNPFSRGGHDPLTH